LHSTEQFPFAESLVLVTDAFALLPQIFRQKTFRLLWTSLAIMCIEVMQLSNDSFVPLFVNDT
jgi:hypothetical protein